MKILSHHTRFSSRLAQQGGSDPLALIPGGDPTPFTIHPGLWWG